MNDDDVIRHLQNDPYGIEAVAMDYPEVINDLMRYVSARHAHQLAVLRIRIKELERARFWWGFWWVLFGAAIGTGVPMVVGLFLGK